MHESMNIAVVGEAKPVAYFRHELRITAELFFERRFGRVSHKCRCVSPIRLAYCVHKFNHRQPKRRQCQRPPSILSA